MQRIIILILDYILHSVQTRYDTVCMQANPLATEQLPHTGTAVKKNLVEVDLGFIHAFLASLSVIIVSELGDKTFFIAAILAMRNPRVTVFTGAMVALGLMTVLSGM